MTSTYQIIRLANAFSKYGMSRHVPVARLVPPESITLPDGRVVPTADLLVKPTDRRSYNLRTKTEYSTKGKRKIAKTIDTQRKE